MSKRRKHYAKMAAALLTTMMAVSVTGITAYADSEDSSVVIEAEAEAGEETGVGSSEISGEVTDGTADGAEETAAGEAGAVTDGAEETVAGETDAVTDGSDETADGNDNAADKDTDETSVGDEDTAAANTDAPVADVADTDVTGTDVTAEDTDGSVSDDAEADGLVLEKDDIDNLGDPIESNGWHEDNEGWYYIQNGERVYNRILRIEGSYYGFDREGYMYANGTFSCNTDYNGNYGTEYYCAKADGRLYVNEWFIEEYEGPGGIHIEKRYYMAGGKAARGFVTIDGIAYMFDNDGYAMLNHAASFNGKNYVSDGDGVAREMGSGWNYSNGYYFYVLNGDIVMNRVIMVDGSYYGFNGNGRMWDGYSFWCDYDADDNYDPRSYRAKSGGALYVNTWYDDNEYWYYYGEKGKAATGIKTVDGVMYLFEESGRLWKNASYTYNGKNYVSDSSGVVTEIKEGWNSKSGYYFYVKNGEIVKRQVIRVGQAYYGFDSDGRMYDHGESFDIYSEDDDRWFYYRAKEGGALYENTWYQPEESSEWYYYGEGGKAPDGIFTVSGTTYLFEYNGRLWTNGSTSYNGKNYVSDSSGVATEVKEGWNYKSGYYYYVLNGQFVKNEVIKVGSVYYGFDRYGRMRDDRAFEAYYSQNEDDGSWYYFRAKKGGALYVNTWYKDEWDDWYYYGEAGKAPNGIFSVGGTKYLFDDNGFLLKNASITVDGKNYVSDNSGVVTELTEGWTKKAGYYYYVMNGQLIQGQVIKIGSSYYGFDGYGRMYEDTTFSSGYHYGSDGDRYSNEYRAKKGGALYVNSWYDYGYGDWRYYGADGKAVWGLVDISGTKYLFNDDGWLLTNSAVTVDGKNYVSNSSGVATEIKEGWTEKNGYYYYVTDGKLIKNQVIKSGSSYYGFDEYGRMYNNTSFEIYDRNKGTYDYYRARSGGSLYVNSWYEDYDGDWRYFGTDGKAVKGLATISGTKYLFNNYGWLMKYGAATIDGTSYIANGSGVVSEAQAGWNYKNGVYYYVKNGEVVRDEVIKIGSVYYGFDGYGRMYDNTIFEACYAEGEDDNWYYFRAKSGGALYVNTWYDDYGDWYYYGASGKCARGVVTVDGKSYLFNYSGRLLKNTAGYYNGKNYASNGSGVVKELKAGWNYWGGYYFYVNNGEVVKDCVLKIGSTYYGFDYSGRMLDDRSVCLEQDVNGRYTYDYYRAKSGGALYVNEWVVVDGDTYYYGQDGKAASGRMTVNGRTYDFDDYGRLIGQAATSTNE